MNRTTPCLGPQDLERPDAAALRHIEECSRCRALHASYRSFMDTAEIPAGARIDEARSAMDALIDAEYGRPLPSGAERRAREAPPTRSFGLRWLLWGVAPAACALFFILLFTGHVTFERGHPVVLRGTHGTLFSVEEPLARSDGSILLRWRAVPHATRYRVRLYDADLRLLEETRDQVDTSLAVPPVTAARLWRVTAYEGTRTLRESEVGTIGAR